MRLQTKLLIGSGIAAALILGLGYAELVLDFRTPRSAQFQKTALGASAALSLHEYNIRRERMRPYGDERAQVSLETGTGRLTVILDGQIVEETWIEREFAGMYGMFVVGRHDNLKHIFPFAIEPGKIPSDHEPNIR